MKRLISIICMFWAYTAFCQEPSDLTVDSLINETRKLYGIELSIPEHYTAFTGYQEWVVNKDNRVRFGPFYLPDSSEQCNKGVRL